MAICQCLDMAAFASHMPYIPTLALGNLYNVTRALRDLASVLASCVQYHPLVLGTSQSLCYAACAASLSP